MNPQYVESMTRSRRERMLKMLHKQKEHEAEQMKKAKGKK